jgi:hypothetical protein
MWVPGVPWAASEGGRNPVREGADDRGDATGDFQPLVDVFQVGAYGSLRYA